MGSETIDWIWRNAVFSFSYCYCSCYSGWISGRIWRTTFRYCIGSSYHCMVFFFAISIDFHIFFCFLCVWFNTGSYKVGIVSDIRCCCCWWQVMYDATGVRLQAGRQAEVWLRSMGSLFVLIDFKLSLSNLNDRVFPGS